MSKEWVDMAKGVPPAGEIVWCHRYFINGSGVVYSKMTLASRNSSCEPKINIDDHAANCYWNGYNESARCNWSDSTVKRWKKLEYPDANI